MQKIKFPTIVLFGFFVFAAWVAIPKSSGGTRAAERGRSAEILLPYRVEPSVSTGYKMKRVRDSILVGKDGALHPYRVWVVEAAKIDTLKK